MVQKATFQHCTNVKELSKKKCKTNEQKDKELNLRMQKKEKKEQCTKEKYKE